MIYKNTITEKMNEIASIIFKEFDEEYYLAGGTALSLQIGHRRSVDLDYFINKEIDTTKLKNFILDKFISYKVDFLFEEKNTLWCSINNVKVSFISRFADLLEKPFILENFRLASLNDLTIMKLSAICSREEYKDYFDLACLSKKTDVRMWNNWWSLIYKNSDPISFIVALANEEKIKKIPLDIFEEFKDVLVKENLDKIIIEIKKFLI